MSLLSGAVGFEGGGGGGVRGGSSRASLAALRARGNTGPTAAEMDDEWDAILADDDEDEEDDEEGDMEEGEEEEEEGEREEQGEGIVMMSDEDMFSADATEGGELDGLQGEGEDGGGGTSKRVWYKSYKERARAEKQREAELLEKRSKFPAHHIAYLDEAQKNRDIAAAR